MEETYYLGVSDPLNLYSACKVWHTGVLKMLVGSENRLLSAMALEEEGRQKWFFEKESVLSLPEKSQVVSIASANPLMIGKRNEGEGNGKIGRRCLIGVTYSIPAPAHENPPPEPEATPISKPPPMRPVGPGSSFVSRILQTARPPPQVQTKPIDSAPQVLTPPRFFFSILGANSIETDHWSSIVQDNITFELPYVPFVLAKYAPPNSPSVLFMLSGSDRKLHIFNQHADVDPEDSETVSNPSSEGGNSDESAQIENHAPASLQLPLLEYYPSPVVSIDVLEALDGQIHVIAGCQDGSIVLSSGDSSGALTRSISTCLDGPITSVKIYQVSRNRWRGSGTMIPTENDQTNPKSTTHPSIRRLHKHIHRTSQNLKDHSPSPFSSSPSPSKSPASLPFSNFDLPSSSHASFSSDTHHHTSTGTRTSDTRVDSSTSIGITKEEKNQFGINIVVASAIGFAAVFRNVTENDFNDFHLLPDSDKHDAVLGIAVGDVDQDGHTEILIGTYGKRILAFAETKGKPQSPSPSSTTTSSSIAPSSTPKRSNSSNTTTSLGNSSSNTLSSTSHAPFNQGVRSEIPPSTATQGGLSSHQNSASFLAPSTSRSSITPSKDAKTSPGLKEASASIRDMGDEPGEKDFGSAASDQEASLSKGQSSISKGLSSVEMGFAKLLDEKKQEYMRDNVVSSVSDSMASKSTTKPSNSMMGVNRVEGKLPLSMGGSSVGVVTQEVGELNFNHHDQGSGNFHQDQKNQNNQNNYGFSLLWRKSFNDPVYQIMCDDFLQDGSVVVIASTMYGIHLLRSDSQNASIKANRRLQLLSDIIKLERQLYRLERNHSRSISNSSTGSTTHSAGGIVGAGLGGSSFGGGGSVLSPSPSLLDVSTNHSSNPSSQSPSPSPSFSEL